MLTRADNVVSKTLDTTTALASPTVGTVVFPVNDLVSFDVTVVIDGGATVFVVAAKATYT